jgi:hypothetical protein
MKMQKYGAMRFVAFVMQLFGWVMVLLGIFLVVIGVMGNISDVPSHLRGLSGYHVIVASGVVLTGIFTVAAGQMVVAIADMATNSWHLREIADHSRVRQAVDFAANAPTVQP